METPQEDELWEDEMPEVDWDIRREGHAWDGQHARPRRHLAPGKIELIHGKLF